MVRGKSQKMSNRSRKSASTDDNSVGTIRTSISRRGELVINREGRMARKEKVTKVIDGDTFETSSRKRPVRLANVNAPEKRQRGYPEAKKALSDLIKGKEVVVETKARDKYGRSVANVKVGNRSVNRAMKNKLK